MLASRGYPASVGIGPRHPRARPRGSRAGRARLSRRHAHVRGDQIVTAGGRVLTVVGRGATYADAMAAAYRAVAAIEFEGMQFRRDIGRKALVADAVAPRS